MTIADDPGATRWHLDKRVPIALIVGMILQTAGALVWAGATMQRIDYLERDNEISKNMIERVTRLEEQVRFVGEGVNRIEQTLRDRDGK